MTKERNKIWHNLGGGTTLDCSGHKKHMLTKCPVQCCLLDCSKITTEIIDTARSMFQSIACRGVNEQNNWLKLYVGKLNVKKSPVRAIWGNHVRKHTLSGRKHWSCAFCKCNPNVANDTDPAHRFKPTRQLTSKYTSCPNYDGGVVYNYKPMVRAPQFSSSCSWRHRVPGTQVCVSAGVQHW